MLSHNSYVIILTDQHGPQRIIDAVLSIEYTIWRFTLLKKSNMEILDIHNEQIVHLH